MLPRFLRKAAGTRAEPVHTLVRLWLFRIIGMLGGHREIISGDSINFEYLGNVLGLELEPEVLHPQQDARKVLSLLRRAAMQMEQEHSHAKPPEGVRRNVARLGKLLGMNRVERRLLEFAVLIQTERALDDTADWLGCMSSVKVMHSLSVILQIREAEIREALASDGLLARSGMLAMDKTGLATLRNKLVLLSDRFADNLVSGEIEPIALLKEVVFLSEPPHLELEDYSHLRQPVTLLKTYLAQVLMLRRRGVNILLYGRPGTGKTQLVRVLARDAGCELFEVASQDGDGDPVGGGARLRAFRAAQSILSNRPALILFDEVEDVFSDGEPVFRRSSGPRSKAWINRTLEENPVPAFWLSNSISCIDSAFIRRFDMVLEVPVPPLAQRQKITSSLCADLLSPSDMRLVSEHESLTPAVVARAAAVVRCMMTDAATGISKSDAVFQIVSGTLTAQGYPPVVRGNVHDLPEIYDPSFINADIHPQKLVEGLRKAGSARLCLSGPPGTGKTAFGRWLAQQLSLRLHAVRASDLLSKWVGGTEQNIAAAFREAQSDGALLLIDEIDSFLADRRTAQRSWEVTLVNEMLTQMESYNGILVASTNLMDALDLAALRRFDIKLQLSYLNPNQAALLFQRLCNSLGLGISDHDTVEQVSILSNLTPGDFATVCRQHRFRRFSSAANLLDALRFEVESKKPSGGRMGFL